MAKVINITDKLNFEESPVLEISGEKFEINDDAITVIKVMQIVEEEESMGSYLEAAELIFGEKGLKRLEKMKLSFSNFTTVIMTAVDLIVDPDGEKDESSGE